MKKESYRITVRCSMRLIFSENILVSKILVKHLLGPFQCFIGS